MNPHFLAIALTLWTACMLLLTGAIVGDAIPRHDPKAAAAALIAGMLMAAIFLNAAVDLW